MKIKKILSIISLLILCLTLTSCVTITDNEKKFVDKLYSQQIGKIEGLVIDENITLSDLKGTFDVIAKNLFGEGCVTRLRTSYYQFSSEC